MISTDIYPLNPNVRGVVVSDLSLLMASSIDITSDLIGLTLNTNIGQPSFSIDDLPLIQTYLGDEFIQPFLANNPYRDLRSAPLNIYVITHTIDGETIEEDNMPVAQNKMEAISSSINTLIENYNYPDGLISIDLSSQEYSTVVDSSPKIMTTHLLYQVRYYVDLDHPYYRLPYTLPIVPAAKFKGL